MQVLFKHTHVFEGQFWLFRTRNIRLTCLNTTFWNSWFIKYHFQKGGDVGNDTCTLCLDIIRVVPEYALACKPKGLFVASYLSPSPSTLLALYGILTDTIFKGSVEL